MADIEEMYARRDSLKAELLELDKEICRNSEHIRRQFHHNPFWIMDRFEELVKKVQFAKKLTPQPGADGEMWQPFVYQMDGKNYNVKFSESELDEGLTLDEGIDMDIALEVWNAEDPIAWLEEHGITEEHKQVGYLLYLTLREDKQS
jgi:hypothetical protein